MGRKIAVLSALGGQGCTLTAAYVGSAMAMSGQSTVITDMCGFGGTLAQILGAAQDAVMNISDVIHGVCAWEDALAEAGENLRVLPSPAFSDEAFNPYSVECRRIVESISRGADVIADMPAGAVPDCGAVRCFDMFVLCSHADSLSLKYVAALNRMIKNAAMNCNCNCDVRLVITSFSEECMKRGGVSDLDRCIDIVGAQLLGVVPFDSEAKCAAICGEKPPAYCEAMHYCGDIARRIFGERVPLDSKLPLFKKSLL